MTGVEEGLLRRPGVPQGCQGLDDSWTRIPLWVLVDLPCFPGIRRGRRNLRDCSLVTGGDGQGQWYLPGLDTSVVDQYWLQY